MSRTKTLSEIFKNYRILRKNTDVKISGICVDSRKVHAGDVFVATSDRNDGHQFIQHAIGNGAVAVIGTKRLSLDVPYVHVRDSREALAHISSVFYDHPADKLILIGVTGTDGKTTTVNLIFNIMKAAGIKAG
ncbi:MAG: hypothetical protein KAH64_01295, partial [Nitrosomonadaceae bacterium]|nr:hypothetical protein [Nitrosomonadaceae bacterium]